MREEWRPAPGWEEAYSVSSLGRVRTRRNSATSSSGSWGGGRGKGQYRCVRISIRNKGRTVRIASLVAGAFIGPRPAGLEINHIDGDVKNNTVANLEYVTALEQQRHASRIGIKAHGEGHGFAKLTDAAVLAIRRSSETERALAAVYGVAPATIHHARVRKTWRHLP